MDIPSIVIAVVLGSLSAILVVVLGTRKKPRMDLDSIPGPKGLPFFGQLFDLSVKDVHKPMLRYVREYGDFVRIRVLGEDIVLITDPVVIGEILGPDLSLPKQESIYGPIKRFAGGDNIVTHVHTDEEYKSMRKAMAVSFSIESLRKQFPIILGRVKRLVERLHGQDPNADVEIDHWLLKLTFDVICEAAFNTKSGALDNKDEPYLNNITKALRMLSATHIDLFLRLKMSLPFTKEGREYNDTRKELHKFEYKLMETLMEKDHGSDDRFIGAQLTRLKDIKTGEPLTIEQLVPHMVVTFIAAFETTAHTVAWALMEVACNPDVQAKLHAELDSLELLVTHERPNPPYIEYSQLKDLTYLNQVLREGMRMHPAGASGTTRVTVAPTKLGPYTVPEGTPVWVPFQAVQNAHSNFLRPDVFLPERWAPDAVKQIEMTEEDKAQQAKYPDATFSGNRRNPAKCFVNFSDGPRSCLGVNMAYLQARLGLATILSHFRIELSPRNTREDILANQTICLTLQPGEGIYLRIRPLAETAEKSAP